MAERALWRGQSGVSDIVSTMLLVLVVVVLGSVLSVLVAQTLTAEAPQAATYALARAHAGDTDAAVALQEGEPVPLDDLRVQVARGAGGTQEVARATWTTPDATILRPGDQLRFPIPGGALAEGERLLVQLTRSSSNSLVASLATSVGDAAPRLSAVTLDATMTPSVLLADATSTALLSVQATQEQGALTVASVVADFGTLGSSATYEVPLQDDGRSGDATGGDGVWSALVRIPLTATTGTYTVTVTATLVDGVTTGTTSLPVTIHSASLNVDENGNAIGNMTGNFTGNSTGAFQGNASGNFSGTLNGGLGGVEAGRRAAEGTRLRVPSSANVTRFDLRNWTMDGYCPYRLNGDTMLIHAVGGSESWSASLTFTWSNSTRPTESCGDPGMYQLTGITMWTRTSQTTYTPTAPINLNVTTVDLLNPLSSGTWTVTGSAHPLATYAYANVTVEPTFILASISDSSSAGAAGGGAGGAGGAGGTGGTGGTTTTTTAAPDTAIYSVDVAFV